MHAKICRKLYFTAQFVDRYQDEAKYDGFREKVKQDFGADGSKSYVYRGSQHRGKRSLNADTSKMLIRRFLKNNASFFPIHHCTYYKVRTAVHSKSSFHGTVLDYSYIADKYDTLKQDIEQLET